MSVVSNNVISKLKKAKTGTTGLEFDDYNIGPELQYVGPQCNSNNNNLEEQLILGTDGKNMITQEVVTPEEGDPYLKITEDKSFAINTAEGINDDHYCILKETRKELSAKVDSENRKLIINLVPKTISIKEDLSFIHNGVEETISEKTTTYEYSGAGTTETATISSL